MYTQGQVLTLADIKKIPTATIWGMTDLVYNALTNPFRANGIISEDAMMASRVVGEGVQTDVQAWTGIPYVESNVSNDDPTDHATPLKTGTEIWTALRNHRNVGVSAMNFDNDVLNQDPLGELTSQVAAYRNQDEVAHIFAILNSLVASDKANGSKITYSQASKGISLQVLLQGLNKLGDADDQITMFGMSSNALLALQLLEANNVYVPPSLSNTQFGTIAGRPIIKDDRFADTTVGGKPAFRLYGMGKGLFHTASAPSAKKPIAVQSDESAGHGSGQDTVWFRWKNIVHPMGYSFNTSVGGTPTFASKGGPTYTELANANSFTRVLDPKKIPLVVIEAPAADVPATS